MAKSAIAGEVQDFSGLAIRASEFQDSSGTVILTSSSGDIVVTGGDIDAGSSGVVGTLDIFPTTAAKGRVRHTAADSAGDTITTVVNASQAAARTYTMPDAGADASFVMTEGSQTINGTKTIAALNSTNIDAGASGTAGSVDVFPTTASKGKTTFTATDNTGNTTTTITNAAQAGAVTYTIPDAGTSASFVMSEGASTINGVKTFGSLPLFKATNAVTAFAGGGQSSATALTSTINSINTCATAADSVKLPAATAGSIIQVSNLGAAYASVFPTSGQFIDGLSADASVSLPSGGSMIFTCAVASYWKSLPATPILPAKFTTGTTATTFAAGQLTGAAFTNYTNTQGTPGSLITRTAAQMFTDDPYARVGGSYILRVTNGQGTGTLTITAGSGVTLTGTATVAANSMRDFVVTYTTASALVIQNIGTGVFS